MKRIALHITQPINLPKAPDCLEVHLSEAVASIIKEMLGYRTAYGPYKGCYTPELLRNRLFAANTYQRRMEAVGLTTAEFHDLICTLREIAEFGIKARAVLIFDSLAS